MITKESRANLCKLLEDEEGYRKFPYKDTVGKSTIGIGRNLVQNGISLEEARYLLQQDISYFIKALHEKISFFDSLDDVRKCVLIDMAFNMGIYGFLGFKRMLNSIENGDYSGASEEMLESKWSGQVGRRSSRLSEMMKTGEWPKNVV